MITEIILTRYAGVLTRTAKLLLLLFAFTSANAELTEQQEQAVAKVMQNKPFIGLVLAHVDEDAVEIHGFGQISIDNKSKPDGSDQFEIGSITKVFTNLLLAELVAKNLVGYDTTIAEILDDVDFDNAAVGQITMLELATHTSGLPRLPGNFAPADPADPYADYGSDDLLEGIATARKGQVLNKTYAYSNFGVGLLGYLLGVLGGQDYEEALATHVLAPLQMDTATFLDLELLVPGHSHGQRVAHWHLNALTGAGGLRAGALELAKLFRPWLSDGGVDFSHEVAGDLELFASAGGNISVTHVWHVAGNGDRRAYWHNGGTGGFRSFAGFNPTTRQGWIVLSNTDDDVTALGLSLLGAPSLQTSAEDNSQEHGESGAFADYYGDFAITPAFVLNIFEKNGQLFVQATGQQALRLAPGGEDVFSLIDVDAQLTFNRENGEIVSLTLHQGGVSQVASRVQVD